MRWHWLVWLVLVVTAARMAHIAFLTPLQGWDSPWRWEFLARQIAAKHTMSFYPPHSPGDFALYAFCDGFPPMISSVYAYLYLAAGRSISAVTGVVVVMQWAATMALAARAAESIRAGAGQWAVVTLAASGLFFWGTMIGQETGLTALATAGLFAAAMNPNSALLALALPLATLALCREYGPGLAVAGSILLVLVREDRKRIALAIALAVLLAVPWSIRTWLLTGNPVWNHRAFGLPVNEVHIRIMDYYKSIFSPLRWSGREWLMVGGEVVARGGAPLLFFLPACWSLARTSRKLLYGTLLFTAMAVLIWFMSLPYTSGGASYAQRVLTPALVSAAVVVGVWITTRWQQAGPRKGVIVLMLVCLAVAVREGRELFVKSEKTGGFLTPSGSPLDGLIPSTALKELLQPGRRILSDDMYLFAELSLIGIEVVPLWSPEVAFVFDPSLPPQEVKRRLVELKITQVMMQHESDPSAYNTHALRDVPFIKMLNREHPPLAILETMFIWRLAE